MRIAFAVAEFIPLAKSGGLGDAAAALARYLQRDGHDVRVFLPNYRQIRNGAGAGAPIEISGARANLGPHDYRYDVLKYSAPGDSLSVHLIDCPDLYDREWMYTADDDEHRRFALLGDAVLGYCKESGWSPDIIHCHDWHAALLPLQRLAHYKGVEALANSNTVLTIHNIGFQGVFSASSIADLGLESVSDHIDQADTEKDRFNFLKTGVMNADVVSTVSPTYAKEILTAEFGHGLEPLLSSLPRPVVGILNGIDTEVWNPMHDESVFAPFSFLDTDGKTKNKVALLENLGLAPTPEAPLIGLVTRLTGQKGLDLIIESLPWLLEEGASFVALGSGEPEYESKLAGFARDFPDRVHFDSGYNETLAHRIFAASDITLVPSVFEPCGLTQMYSMRYGAIPVVRRTGGLADTVPAFNPLTGSGLGFTFDAATVVEFKGALNRALRVYGEPAQWQALVRAAMTQDFSWEHPGAAYVELFRALKAS